MINVALKEWSVICDLLLDGRMAFVLRKGGIIEDRGPGVFDLKHDQFALFPSWAHQKPEMIKPEFREGVELLDEPERVTIRGYTEAAHIWQVPHRAAVDALDDLHPWSAQQIDMRFDYKPENPLYVVALRAYRLATPIEINNLPEYGGCRSWIELDDKSAIDQTHAEPTMDDAAFHQIVQRIDQAMNSF